MSPVRLAPLAAGMISILLVAPSARAQMLTVIGRGVTYDGAVYSYNLSGGRDATTLDFLLGDYLEILSVRAVSGELIYSQSSPGGCPDPWASSCAVGDVPASVCPSCGTISVGLSYDGSDRHLTFSTALAPNPWPEFLVTVRADYPASNCSSPLLQFLGSIDPSQDDPEAGQACNDLRTLASLATTPSSLESARGAGALPLSPVGSVSAAGDAILNETVFDPLVFNRVLRCRRVVPNETPPDFGDCAASPFSEFAQVLAVSEFPLQFSITANDVQNPLPGNAELQLNLGPTSAVFPVKVEANATIFTIDASGPSPVGAGGSVQFSVVDARSPNGNEPRTVSWSITSVEPATYLADAQRWFAPTTGLLTIDAAPPENVVVTIRGTHRNPDASEIYSDKAVTVAAQVTPPAASCVLVADREALNMGETTLVQLQRRDGTALPAELSPRWTVVNGGGELTQTSNIEARYVAPITASTAVISVSEIPTTACAESSLELTLAVTADVQVSLTAEPQVVQPGALAYATVRVGVLGSTPANLGVRMRFENALRGLGSHPRPSGGMLLDANATDATVSAGPGLFDAVTAPVGTSSLHYVALARAAYACGPGRMTVEVYRTGGSSLPIARAEAKVDLACEPELTEATVVGRVFHDVNENGQQDEGEPGLPGVMVASSAGVYARTDATGSYHLVRLSPGRQAIKVNAATLPPGAAPDLLRREVTLTPGVFVRVSFPVRLLPLTLAEPLAVVREQSGVALAASGPVYRLRLHLPASGEVSATRGEVTVVAPKESEREATLELPLSGEPHWLIALRADDGRLFLWSFAIHSYVRAAGDTLVVPWGPRPLAGVALPPPRTAVDTDRLVLRAEAAAATQVAVEGGKSSRCRVDEEAQPCVLGLVPGAEQTISLQLDPAADAAGDDPPPASLILPIDTRGSSQFFVALGGGQIGRDFGAQASKDIEWDAGGSFFYRGVLGPSFLVTGGADASAQDLLFDNGTRRSASSSIARFFGHDPRRVFTDLDPEQYYPTYGDDSQSVDERESGGRFFLRVEKGRSFFKWGGINTGLNGTEVGQYVRSLYGFGGQLELDEPDAKVGVRARAFGARPDSIAARDEFVVTGGSLYFLNHRDVVEGSIRASLELRDEISGLPVRVVPLVEGADFQADYVGGRLTLDAAVPYRTFGTTLTSPQGGGQRGRLLVDYEYAPVGDLTQDWTVGGGSTVRLGPVALGATAVSELAGDLDAASLDRRRYTLLGAHAGLDLGPFLRVRAELARSEGGSHAGAESTDGGLTFTDLALGAGDAGNAALVEMTTAFSGVNGTVYSRYRDAGFADSRTAPGLALRQGGLKLSVDLATRTRLWVQADHREERANYAPSCTRELALVGASQGLGPLRLGVEGRYEGLPSDDARRALLAGEVITTLGPRWQLSARRLQELAAEGEPRVGEGGSESSVGALYTAAGAWTAGAEAGATDELEPFGRLLASVPLVDGTELYASYAVLSPVGSDLGALEDPSGSRLILGGRRGLQGGTSLYAEQQLRVDGAERRLARSVGVSTPLARRIALTVAYERGLLDMQERTRDLTRDAGNASVAYVGEHVNAQLGADARFDNGSESDALQVGARGRLELIPVQSLRLAASGRGANSYASEKGGSLKPTVQTWEATAGFAVRPHGERVNVFGRYALTQERRLDPQAGAATLTTLSHVVALALIVNLVQPFDLGPKIYFRHTGVELADSHAKDQAALGVLRGDLHLDDTWDATLEGRACAVPGSDTASRYGALVEASALVVTFIRLGAGYNFSSISTTGVRCHEPSARGVFVRAEAIY